MMKQWIIAMLAVLMTVQPVWYGQAATAGPETQSATPTPCNYEKADEANNELASLEKRVQDNPDDVTVVNDYVDRLKSVVEFYSIVSGGQATNTISTTDCLRLLNIQTDDQWEGLDIRDATQALGTQTLEAYASLAVLRQLILLASPRDYQSGQSSEQDSSPAEGLYHQALMQLVSDKALSQDPASLETLSFQLAYAQAQHPATDSPDAVDVPAMAKAIEEQKKAQLLDPADYDEKISKANAFTLALTVVTIAAQKHLEAGDDIGALFDPGKQESFFTSVGLPYNDNIKEVLDHPIISDLHKLYDAYLNNIPNGALEARAQVLYDVAMDVDKQVYHATPRQPLLLGIPEMADELFDTVAQAYPTTGAAQDAKDVILQKNKSFFSGPVKVLIAGGVLVFSAYWFTIGTVVAGIVLTAADAVTGAGEQIRDLAQNAAVQLVGDGKYVRKIARGVGGFVWDTALMTAAGGINEIRQGGLNDIVTEERTQAMQAILARMFTRSGATKTELQLMRSTRSVNIVNRFERYMEGTKIADEAAERYMRVLQKTNAIITMMEEPRLTTAQLKNLRDIILKSLEVNTGVRLAQERVSDSTIRALSHEAFEKLQPSTVLTADQIKSVFSHGGNLLTNKWLGNETINEGMRQGEKTFASYGIFQQFAASREKNIGQLMNVLVIHGDEVLDRSSATTMDSFFIDTLLDGTHVGNVSQMDVRPLWEDVRLDKEQMKEILLRSYDSMFEYARKHNITEMTPDLYKQWANDVVRLDKYRSPYTGEAFDPWIELQVDGNVPLTGSRHIVMDEELRWELERRFPYEYSNLKKKIVTYEQLGLDPKAPNVAATAYQKLTGLYKMRIPK